MSILSPLLEKPTEGKTLLTMLKLGLKVRGCHLPSVFVFGKVKSTLNKFLVTISPFKLVTMDAV